LEARIHSRFQKAADGWTEHFGSSPGMNSRYPKSSPSSDKDAAHGSQKQTSVLRVFFFFASFPFSLSRNKEKEMKKKAWEPKKA